MRYIDLSVALQNDLPVDRPGNGPHIRYQHHHETFEALAKPFAGLRPEDLPDGEAWAVERLDLSTHNGTHMDAPWHYASTMDGGQPAATIDQVPLEWCHRPGVKLDLRHLPDGHVATARDVETELRRIGHELQLAGELAAILVDHHHGLFPGQLVQVGLGVEEGVEEDAAKQGQHDGAIRQEGAQLKAHQIPESHHGLDSSWGRAAPDGAR